MPRQKIGDIVIFNNQGRPALLRNDAISAGGPVDELRVEWPDGLVSRFAAVPAGATYTVRRAAAQSRLIRR